MKIAIVGGTGLVGSVMLKVLEERNFPVDELLVVASEKSVGKSVLFKKEAIKIISMQAAIAAKPVIALFSAGGSVSEYFAPKFAAAGTFVIDNSSAWRMDASKKLIVPEINGNTITEKDKIIANPNCSTIQLVMALAPLHLKYHMKRIIVSTYQSITGTGVNAVQQMENERKGIQGEMAYPYAIDKNCLPQCDVFADDGYTKEELKLVNETRKILNNNNIGITATAVRVPVVGGHSESVNVEFEKDFDLTEIRHILHTTKGVELQDDVENQHYPMAKFAEGKDAVFVGRLRRDHSQANSLNMWIVADNLRKGAATNAVQIAELLLKNIL